MLEFHPSPKTPMASTSTTSQPIALPIVHANPNSAGSYVDFQMADGSYTGSSGPFNPASYTRHFLGSPISWRASSFNLAPRFPDPSTHGSVDGNDIRYGRPPTSENRESLLNALNLFDREGELCRNYTCCGLHLNDLHALLEHFEAVHILVLDGDTQNPQMQIPFNPIANPIPLPLSSESLAGFDPDDMELELDLDNNSACVAFPITASHSSPSSGAPSPPDTPISTPLSAWPSPHAFRSHHITPASSLPPSPRSKTAAPTRASSPVPASALRPNLSLNLGGASAFSRAHAPSPHILTNPEDAFNSYARFSQDYSSGLPGAQYNAAPADEASMATPPPQITPWQQNGLQQQPGCVPPALLFSSSTTGTPASTPSGSRVPSPSSYAHAIAQAHAHQPHQLQGSVSMPTTPISSTPTSRPAPLSRTSSTASPSFLLSKPFKCPKPNCNKSYKQANGLKYHMTHGSCNFAPPKDLEHVRDLLERKKREREKEREREFSLGRTPSTITTPTTSGPASPTTELAAEYGISEMDLREVEREAERRLRPFACGVADCQRRYKNMNGLRYHYQHSGEHGAQGLVLLASGQHECLQGSKRRDHHNNQNTQLQQQSPPQPQNQYTTVEDREGKRRLVIRPTIPQSQSQAQQIQEQRNGLNAGAGASSMVPATVCDQQSQQTSPIPQQPNMTQIHVTPVVVSPSVSQQGQQQQSAAVYAGQYSPSSQQPNPYAYACYTPPTASNANVSHLNSLSPPGSSSPSSPGNQTSTPITSPITTNAYQQQGYFNGSSNGYLGMSGMNLGLGLAPGGVNSLMGLQNGGYNQSTQAQLAAFHQQLKDQYREYAAQVQQQQQQSQETKEGTAV